MALNDAERERLHDMRLKLQSAARSLCKVNPTDVPDFEEIESCLEDADQNLRLALQASDAHTPEPKSDRDTSR